MKYTVSLPDFPQYSLTSEDLNVTNEVTFGFSCYHLSSIDKENKISTVPEFVDSFFSGIYKTSFICQLCQETNIYYEPFHHITVQPNTDIFAYLAKDFRENKILLVGNALLSLVNLYAQVTKKRPIFF